MKQHINRYIIYFLRFYDKRKLSSYSGTYYSKPLSIYVSQFVGIYPSSIRTDVTLVSQTHIKEFGARDIEEFNTWAWRNCGIACVKMVLEAYGKAKDKTIMDLTNEGVNLGGYVLYDNRGILLDKGWLHHALVNLLRTYGVPTIRRRWQTVEAVAAHVLKNKKVIISVFMPQRRFLSEDGSYRAKPGATYGGHLLLVTGVEMHNGHVQGIYVHDPVGLEHYQKNTFISRKRLEKIFTNRSIVAG